MTDSDVFSDLDTVRGEKLRQLDALLKQATAVEAEIAAMEEGVKPRFSQFYTAYYATTGFLLGSFGAITSLLFNVVGGLAVEGDAMKLIRVYLTFPMGKQALEMSDKSHEPLLLALGCCLYIATGMALGVLFQIVIARTAGSRGFITRCLWSCGLGVVVWLVAFYCILTWLQPLLFGGNWIVEQIPWYVGLATHLVYAVTHAAVFPLGVYTPYRLPPENV
jgi:hypothetical protein